MSTQTIKHQMTDFSKARKYFDRLTLFKHLQGPEELLSKNGSEQSVIAEYKKKTKKN